MKRALIILALASLACMTPVIADDTSTAVNQSERRLPYVAPPVPTPEAFEGEKWRMP